MGVLKLSLQPTQCTILCVFLKLGTLKVYPLVLSKEQEMYSTIKNIEDYSAQKVRGWYHPEILTRVYIVGKCLQVYHINNLDIKYSKINFLKLIKAYYSLSQHGCGNNLVVLSFLSQNQTRQCVNLTFPPCLVFCCTIVDNVKVSQTFYVTNL